MLHRNVPNVISRATSLFGEAGFNIDHMVSTSRGNYACALFDLNDPMRRDFALQLSEADDILKIRVIQHDSAADPNA